MTTEFLKSLRTLAGAPSPSSSPRTFFCPREKISNLIELGPGIFGVQAASRHYFGRDVFDLSLEEIVRLTAVIPRPVTTDPRESKRWLNWRCRMILEKLRFYKKIREDEYQSLIGKFQ
jgi:membrane peptidoglycan carboxypeptidase